MNLRAKSALAHILTLLLVGSGWFSYMPRAINRGTLLPELAFVGAGLLFLGNALLYVYLRTLRCPKCRTRFGPKMYRSGLIHLPWPRQDCWNCGINLAHAEEREKLGPPFKKSTPPAQGFPLRWRAILALVVVWNALGLASLFLIGGLTPEPTQVMAIALVLLLVVSWGTKHLRVVQRFILSDGHSVEEIKRLLTFFQAFAIFGLAALTVSEIIPFLFG